MGLFDKQQKIESRPRLKSKYQSAEELKIFPGQIRYDIYTRIIEGKSDEQIYKELVEIGQYDQTTRTKYFAMNYIEYFRKKMER